MDYQHKLTEVLNAVGMKVTPHSSQSFADFSGFKNQVSSSTLTISSNDGLTSTAAVGLLK